MKIENLYNIRAAKAFEDSAKQLCDAAPGLVLGESLIALDPKIFERKYAELVFLNSGLDVDNTGGYSEAVRSLRISETGGFKTAGAQSANKGKISLEAQASLIEVLSRTAESLWTKSDVEKAALQNINLVDRFVAAHQKIYSREVDQIIALGVEDLGTEGLLNYSGFTATAAADTAEELAATDPESLYGEVASFISAQHSRVQNTPEHMVDVVVFPTRVYNVLQATILNANGSTKNVLRALQDNFPSVSFYGSSKGDDESLAASTTVAYSTNEDAMKVRIPQPLTFAPVFEHGFKYETESMYRIAGIDVLEDSAGSILNGL